MSGLIGVRSVDNAEAVNLVFSLGQAAWQLPPTVHSARATRRLPDEVGLGDPVQLIVTELVTHAVRRRWRFIGMTGWSAFC